MDPTPPPSDTVLPWSAAETPFSEPTLWKSWRSLAAKAPPFLRPEFFALQEPLIEGGQAFVAAAYRGQAMEGALPLVRCGRTLRSLASDHAPLYDYVGDPDGVDGIWRALVADPEWDTIVLDRVPSTSPLLARLPGLAMRDLCLTSIKQGNRSPYFALPRHEGRLSAKMKQNLRRWAKHVGGVELERITGVSRAALEEGWHLEGLAWKTSAGTSIESSATVRHFYHAVARLAARHGELSLYFLRAQGRRIAFLYALEDGRTLYALKTGYDPEFASFGPGHLLFAEVARNAEARGLLELCFMGKSDEWKRRWTPLTHDTVTLVIYRPTLRGAVALVGREIVKPRLSPSAAARVDNVRLELARRQRHCQQNDRVGVHTPLQLLVGRVQGGLGIRSGIRRILAPPSAPKPRLGAPSKFEAGDWVRVVDADRVRATLDAKNKLRGLVFVPAQFESCGNVYRVQKPMLRMVDDRGELRPVSRTVLLDGMTCDGHTGGLGCGRHCPLMFRDEWLEPAEPPSAAVPQLPHQGFARVRSQAEIEATLDERRRKDGVTFMPEMARFAGKRLPIVRRLPRVFELDRWTPPRGPIYLLEGAFCTGAAMGEEGPCDRACALLWHGDWLDLESDSTSES